MGGTSNDELLVLHRALVEGSADASVPLAEKLIPILKAKLGSLNAEARDPHVVESAIGYGVARYLKEPEAYDPTGRTLPNYLAMDIEGDVRNELAKRRRQQARQESLEEEVVELRSRDRNSTVEDEALDAVDPFDLPQAQVDAARRLLGQLAPRDRELAQLVADGVRSYAAWATMLGIEHLPVEVQKREVKRQKDRIKKKLERMGERSG